MRYTVNLTLTITTYGQIDVDALSEKEAETLAGDRLNTGWRTDPDTWHGLISMLSNVQTEHEIEVDDVRPHHDTITS